VRSLLVTPATLLAMLVLAPAALASTYTVDDPGDGPDVLAGDDVCDTGGGVCTLRAAIQESNAHAGADVIDFTVSPANVQAFNAATTSDVTDPATIDGGGTTSVTFDPTAVGPLFEVSAGGTTVKGLTFTGGQSGAAVSLEGGGDKLDHVTVDSAPGVGVAVSGGSVQLTNVTVTDPAAAGVTVSGPNAVLSAPTVTSAGQTGIAISGSGAHVTNPEVSAAHASGIAVTANSANFTGGRVHGNGGDGITITGQGVVVTKVVIFGNSAEPISLGSGANGGVQPPEGLRIGPRQADGSLPLTGSTPGGGSIELWSGSPFGPLAPAYLDTFSVSPGSFSHNFATEPQPGATFAAALTTSGTSESSTVAVPGDVVSPDIARARAISTTEVRVIPTEPLDSTTVQAADFTLTMAGKDREVTAATMDPVGGSVTLTSSGWKAGEAGYVQLKAPGAVTDAVGNQSLVATRLRVAAAPGDFLAPIAAQLALLPKSICLTRGRGCRTTGTKIRFVTTEPGKATIVLQRGNKRIGSRTYSAIGAGLNTLKFNGRLGGRKLRAGRYRVLLYVQDLVGNVTDQPPIRLMTVRRVTK
jgi:Right handed beta helix region